MPRREYYQKHKEHIRTYAGAYAKKWKKEIGFKNTWDKKHPEYVKIKGFTNTNIKDKKPCEKCGTDKDIQKHHDDYSKPLEVRWLCRLCHAELHAELRFNKLKKESEVKKNGYR